MKYEYWFAAAAGIGLAKRMRLLELFGSAKQLYHTEEKELLKTGVDSETATLLIQSRQKWQLDKEWEKLEERHIHMVTVEQGYYPRKLSRIAAAPYALFYKGALPDEEQKTLAIVGARNCSEYGRYLATEIGAAAARAGLQVISGMALGIDGAGHSGAIREHGITHAVLGCGVDCCYPRQNRSLYEALCLHGGVLSEFVPGTPPLPQFFPRRNRIISGLSDVVVVVEARERSGSLITADYALEQGKDVYAVPGRVGEQLSAGCNRLIRQGAGIVISIEDFFKELQVAGISQPPEQLPAKKILEKDACLVYSVMDLQPKSISELVEKTGLQVDRVCSILIGLENVKMIREVSHSFYVRSEMFSE